MGAIFTNSRDLYEHLIHFIWTKNPKTIDKKIIKTYVDASLGVMQSSELWKRLGFELEYPQIEKEYLDSTFTIDQEFLELLPEFKNKYKLALFSNDVSEWSTYLRNKFGLNEIFDEVIISGVIGIRKPNLEFFRLLIERIAAKPEESLFIDDSLYNLKAASELGMHTLRFIRQKEKIPFCSEFEISNFSELRNILKVFY